MRGGKKQSKTGGNHEEERVRESTEAPARDDGTKGSREDLGGGLGGPRKTVQSKRR